MPSNFTEKGQNAFDLALKHFKDRVFSAAELSEKSGETIRAATLNGIVTRGYMYKVAGTPVKFGFVENIDELLEMDKIESKKGCTNAKGNEAKKAKNNEFYTLMSEIEAECFRYKQQFYSKSIFCNCNDGLNSNFFNYFFKNFDAFGLTRLVGISYAPEGQALKYTVEDGDPSMIIETPLQGTGSFLSDESIEELDKCDIVVTNPPFSEFNKLIDLLMDHKKKFLILGNNTSINLKNVFYNFKMGNMWYGYKTNATMKFTMPDDYESDIIDEDGNKIGKVPAISWYTNLKVSRRDDPLVLTATYYSDTNKREAYPTLDNSDIILVGRVENIPSDYAGVMAVPITYVNHHCADQFELIANSSFSDKSCFGCGSLYLNGKKSFARVLIKRTSMDMSYLY